MRLLDLNVKKIEFDIIKGTFTYSTGETPKMKEGEFGIIMPEEDNVDRVILNPLYINGEVIVKTKAISQPAKKYEVGDKIATLVIFSY